MIARNFRFALTAGLGVGVADGAAPSRTSASFTIAAMPFAPAGVRWIPSGCSHAGFSREMAFQSSTVISGCLRAIATIVSFMVT